MIWGDAYTEEGELVLNLYWPQRGLWYCTDPDGDDAYVWADNTGDAIETLAEWNGHEGDDDHIQARKVFREELEQIKQFTDQALEAYR